MADKPIQQRTTPYLTVKGANEAIALYQKAFNAREQARMPAQDGKSVMHAELVINGGVVMLADEFPEHAEYGAVAAPSAAQPAAVAVTVSYDTPAEVDATFDRAVAAGCSPTMKPEDMFFGLRFAMLADPFGHRWMLVAELPQTS